MAANQRNKREHAHPKRHAKNRPKAHAQDLQKPQHKEGARDDEYLVRQDEPEAAFDTRVGPVYEEFRFLGAYNAT